MPNIKPISDLRNYNEVLRDVEEGSPVFLTKNGRGKYAIVELRDYEKAQATIRLMNELAKGRHSGETEAWRKWRNRLGSHMNKLQVSKAAQKDLQEIKAYLAVDLENPGVAVAAVSKITKKIRLLKDNPLMGPALTAVTDANSDERFLVCGNYLVFYSVTRENIFIDRVLYGRRDYLRVLFGEQADTVQAGEFQPEE